MVTTKSFDVEAMLESMVPIKYGVVRWFDGEHGYGFVIPADGGFDLFLDVSELIEPAPAGLRPGQPVSYSDGGTRHWPKAAAVHVL